MFEVLAIVSAIFVWIAYHKIFRVFYFDLSRGCIVEIIVSLFCGAALAYLIMNYWFIAVPILVLVILGMAKK